MTSPITSSTTIGILYVVIFSSPRAALYVLTLTVKVLQPFYFFCILPFEIKMRNKDVSQLSMTYLYLHGFVSLIECISTHCAIIKSIVSYVVSAGGCSSWSSILRAHDFKCLAEILIILVFATKWVLIIGMPLNIKSTFVHHHVMQNTCHEECLVNICLLVELIERTSYSITNF